MKDHEIAKLVNDVRDCAIEYGQAQQLRERLAAILVPVLRGARTPEWKLGRWWSVVGQDGKIWCETSVEYEARRAMRPGDKLYREYVCEHRVFKEVK